MTDIFWSVIISIIFLILFVVAEFCRKQGANTEITRKFVHFSGAFVTIFFPFILKSSWSVLALAVLFAEIMFFTKKMGLLQSVHGVERESRGAIYHPVAIYICFLYSQLLNQPWFYVISILILAISDASAALVGKRYGSRSFIVEIGSKKSLEGSFTFFLTAFLTTHLILLLATQTGRLESVLVGILIASIVTIFEGGSLEGTDNLFVPIGAMFILSKNISPVASTVAYHIGILFLFLALYLLIMKPYKKIGFSGIILLGLINYIIWALLGNIYALIVFIFSYLCQKTDFILNYSCDVADSYRVKPVFYILTVPLICAFAGDFLNNYTSYGELIFYPFITSVILEGIIIRTKMFNGNLNKGLLAVSVISLAVLGASYVLIR